MASEPCLSVFTDNLRKVGVKYAILPLENGFHLLVTEHWGKAFGPFENDADPGTLWVSSRAEDAASLREMVETGDWCIGGDRLWLAPEVQFNIVDRKEWNQEGGYRLPGSIDPGNYRLSGEGSGSIVLTQTIEASLHNLASGTMKAAVTRRFFPAADPLERCERYRVVRHRVRFTGYSEETTIEALSAGDFAVEAWNLLQVRPEGVAVLPVTGAVQYQDYYEPVDGAHLEMREKAAVMKLTGKRKYKTGWKSAGVWGRIGYYREMPGGVLRLIIRNFFNNPSSRYVDEPFHRENANGDSVQFYNDDGSLGGFGEIEVHGQALGPHRERKSVNDYFEFWQYTGMREEMKTIGELLLGTPIVSW